MSYKTDFLINSYKLIRMSHQDWTPMVLKKQEKKPPIQRRLTTIDINEEEKDFKTKMVKKETADAIMKARNEKGLNQTDLAKKCNLTSAIINSIERCNYPYQPEVINSISRVLGVKIPR